jgi:hypothetical protein
VAPQLKSSCGQDFRNRLSGFRVCFRTRAAFDFFENNFTSLWWQLRSLSSVDACAFFSSRCVVWLFLVWLLVGLVGCATPRSDASASWRSSSDPVVVTARQYLGTPYRWGGDSVGGGFDCSGFTRRVFQDSIRFNLPRRAEQQAQTAGLLNVSRTALRPGDLVFFNTLQSTYSHVGIYVGASKFIHAPRTGAHVRVEDMRLAYWASRYTGARRVDGRSSLSNTE